VREDFRRPVRWLLVSCVYVRVVGEVEEVCLPERS
jgi:hypothetical protein